MTLRRKLALTLLLLPLSAAPAPAQTADQATTFLRHLYDLYEHPPTELGPDILVKHPLQVYSPRLYRLVRHDQLRAGPGNVGNLDYDPICVCQDNGGMKLAGLQVIKTGPTTATASVTLTFPQPLTIHARLLLVWTPAGWRVDDVQTQDTPSLRALLR
jgi:hypothetical protein